MCWASVFQSPDIFIDKLNTVQFGCFAVLHKLGMIISVERHSDPRVVDIFLWPSPLRIVSLCWISFNSDDTTLRSSSFKYNNNLIIKVQRVELIYGSQNRQIMSFTKMKWPSTSIKHTYAYYQDIVNFASENVLSISEHRFSQIRNQNQYFLKQYILISTPHPLPQGADTR